MGWVVSAIPRPRFTSGTHWVGDWVSFRVGLDTEARGKILCLFRGSNPARPVSNHTVYWLSYLSSPTISLSRILILSFHLRVNLPDLFPSGFPTKILFSFLISHILVTYSTIFDSITVINQVCPVKRPRYFKRLCFINHWRYVKAFDTEIKWIPSYHGPHRNHPGINSRPLEAAVLRRQSHTLIINPPIYTHDKCIMYFRDGMCGWMRLVLVWNPVHRVT
jgi:hypothetical protein